MLNKFPIEIIQFIFGFLSLKDLLKLTKVCSLFQKIEWKSTQVLDFSPFPELTSSIFLNLLQIRNPDLKVLNLSGCKKITNDLFLKLPEKYFKSIISLNLSYCSQIDLICVIDIFYLFLI